MFTRRKEVIHGDRPKGFSKGLADQLAQRTDEGLNNGTLVDAIGDPQNNTLTYIHKAFFETPNGRRIIAGALGIPVGILGYLTLFR